MTVTLPWPLLAKRWINYLSLLYFLSRFISVCQMLNTCSLVIFIHSVVLAYILLWNSFVFSTKKINNYSRWNICTIAHKHKHSHFRPKATGLHYLSGSMGRKKQQPPNTNNTLHLCIWVRGNIQSRLCWPSTVPRVFAPRFELTTLCLSLQSLTYQCSGSHSAVKWSLVNYLGGHWWGSKWSSLPSPSPWRHLDIPAGIHCWPTHGTSL